MKKMKKIAALLLAMAMVMGMSLTAFAGEETEPVKKEKATITVQNAEGAELSYMQIIKTDETKRTGWAFMNDAVKDIYVTAFGETGEDADQAVIDELINARKASTDGYAETTDIAKALADILISTSEDISFVTMSNPQEVTAAGVYAIKAVDSTTATTRYNYSAMAAYVGFGAKEGELYPSLQDAIIEAKKTEINVEKTNDDQNKVVGVGDIVTFTIKTNVPPVNPNQTAEFYIYDTINGADFYLEGTDATASVTMNGEEVAVGTKSGKDLFDVDSDNDNQFSINLSSLVTNDNANRDKEIIVTYTAKINGDIVTNGLTNNATAGNAGTNKTLYGEDNDNLYTGIITLKKVDVTSKAGLAGATFHVQTTKNDDTTALSFIETADGVYTYTNDPSATGATKDLVVASDGNLTVKGLNVAKYYLAEMVAPEGYSRIMDAKEAELKLEKDANGEDIPATENITFDSGNFDNTKLSALPSTGGIGTTIFTIGGCLIMIVAAGLFFATRKKSAK